MREKAFNMVSLITIALAAVLMIGGIAYFMQQQEAKKAIEVQTSKTNQLIGQAKELTLEVKGLSQENKTLSEQNKNYAYCNAVLLARYTQTQEPIVIEDLDKCVLTSFPETAGGQSTFFTPQVTKPSETVQPKTANPQNPTPPKSDPPTQQPQNPQPNNPQTLLTIPDLLQINTPCLNVLGLIKTCQ